MEEGEMKRNGMVIASLLLLVFFAGTALAGSNPVETVLDGCKKELETYCKDVTPGQGRILACLYAHQDKLSGRCDYALYDAAAQLERAVAALTFLVNECRDDLEKLCANIAPGQGRLLNCLEKNEAKVSNRCKQAFKDVSRK
jgi:hypothetical protein